MDSRFLFGVDGEESNEVEKSTLHKDKRVVELLANIKEEVDYAHTQLCNLNDQLSTIDHKGIEKSFVSRKCALLIEYLNNVYAFHTLKNNENPQIKTNTAYILRRINNIKSVLDRLSPLEARLTNYLKNVSKNKSTTTIKSDKLKSNKNKSDKIESNKLNTDMDLMPNLSALADHDSDDKIEYEDSDESNLQPNLSNHQPNLSNLQPNLSNLAPLDQEDEDEDENDSENDDENDDENDSENGDEANKGEDVEQESINVDVTNKKSASTTKNSKFIPSRSRYMPYDDVKTGQLTSRKRKEFDDQQKHRDDLQKSIVDELLNLERDTPSTYGMKEFNNAGYLEKNNPFSQSSSKKDVRMAKDRRLVLMMNDLNENGKFVDKSMEELADSMTNKLNSKKYKAKLAKRKTLRARFRKRTSKRR